MASKHDNQPPVIPYPPPPTVLHYIKLTCVEWHQYDLILFLSQSLNHIRLYKHYHIVLTLYQFYFTDIMVYIYLCGPICFVYYYYYHALGALLLSIIPMSFYANHTT